MSDKNDILILTTNFPYSDGEQFIEKEIPFWVKTPFEHVYIFPYQTNGQKRFVPEGIETVEEDLPKNILNLLYVFVILLCQSFFYRELNYIFQTASQNKWGKCFIAIKTGLNLLHYRRRLHKVLRAYPNITMIYSYWNDILSYAACLEKKTSPHSSLKVISRTHGFDLYQERKTYGYMPYKWQFCSDFDRIFTLSPRAKHYYEKTYSAHLSTVSISRLGVQVDKLTKIPNHKILNQDSITIVSIAYCIQVKRLDKTLAAITQLAITNPQKNYTWVHFGGGALLDSLKQQTQLNCVQISNLNIIFKGHQDNTDILSFLKHTPIHVLINNSEYEGTPVSIMEAMAAGIPVVAPNIGGISDIIEHKKNGYLMSSLAHIDEIVQALNYVTIANHNNWSIMSENAYKTATNKYNAQLNFPSFIQEIQKINKQYE